MPRPETKWSGDFGKIPDLDWDHGVWSSPDQVPIGPGLNLPNTTPKLTAGSNEPSSDHWTPTNEPYPWNDDTHRSIIEERDCQDHITAVCIM